VQLQARLYGGRFTAQFREQLQYDRDVLRGLLRQHIGQLIRGLRPFFDLAVKSDFWLHAKISP